MPKHLGGDDEHLKSLRENKGNQEILMRLVLD